MFDTCSGSLSTNLCDNRTVDKGALGERLAQAREAAGMTQGGLGQAVGLDRTAITRLENGERKLSAVELVAIAKVLGRPLSDFVSTPVPAVVSRRSDTALAHDTTRALDMELDGFASDVRALLEMRLLVPGERPVNAHTPNTHEAAEQMARDVRQRLGLGDGPLSDLGEIFQRLGLHTYSASLGEGGPDGGCVEVSGTSGVLGVAVINGDAPPGRRRMTLTHEFGHWLCGDAYDRQTSLGSEQMINSFAIHFLAPRSGLQNVWNEHPTRSTRDRALAVGASFRLSWSAVVSQLRNVNIIDWETHRYLSGNDPRQGDYVRLGFSWVDELNRPYVSPGFAAACVNGFVSGQLTSDRVIELLRGTLAEDDLPQQELPSHDDVRKSFEGHGD